MKIIYKNLKLDFSYTLKDEEEPIGYCSMSVKGSDAKDFLADIFPYEDEVTNLFKAEIEDISENGFDSSSTIYNADLMIVFFCWALSAKSDAFEIEYQGDSPAWLLHDICHAENDCYNDTVSVDAYREERAVFESMEKAKDLGLLHCFSPEMFSALNKEFNTRFYQDFPMSRALNYLNDNLN